MQRFLNDPFPGHLNTSRSYTCADAWAICLGEMGRGDKGIDRGMEAKRACARAHSALAICCVPPTRASLAATERPSAADCRPSTEGSYSQVVQQTNDRLVLSAFALVLSRTERAVRKKCKDGQDQREHNLSGAKHPKGQYVLKAAKNKTPQRTLLWESCETHTVANEEPRRQSDIRFSVCRFPLSRARVHRRSCRTSP